MILWSVLTMMTVLASVALAAPFLRRLSGSDIGKATEVDVYRDQLNEISREQAADQIEPAEAAAARQEIGRRLLAADQVGGVTASAEPRADRTYAAIGIAAVVALGSTILYSNMGSPELPSQSVGQRSTNQVGASTQEAAGSREGATVGSVEEMIERLALRLQVNPNDPEGWGMLGWSYLSQERFAEAASAYAKAIEQAPANAKFKTARGEAMVRAADGMVTVDAIKLFEQSIKLDARDPRARFFIGLRKEQAGEKTAALEDWLSLLSEAAPDEPWAGDLRQRIEDLAAELKIDVSSRVSQVAPAAPVMGGILGKLEADAARDRGPTAADVEKAEALTSKDRTAMIRGMVDGLQSRLEQSPRDADGWIKLIRSRSVLGEKDAARAALDKALAVFAKEPEQKSRIRGAAREAGLVAP